MSASKQLVCVTGLPRAGSTLLCQLLSHHSAVYSPGHSSPLLATLNTLRQQLSKNDFMLSQMDVDFELSYQRLKNAYRGFVDGWFAETDLPLVVDKNRSWMNQLDLAQQLCPETKMLVCVRNPEQIYGSVESKHQATLLLDFPDNLAHLSPYQRADTLFGSDGVIGGPLNAIANLQDLSPEQQSNYYFVVFEQLMQEPESVMADIFNWLGLNNEAINTQQLTVRPHESDSYYRFKYPHKTRSSISPPTEHTIPLRIRQDIQQNFHWFYENFYPGALMPGNGSNNGSNNSSNNH